MFYGQMGGKDLLKRKWKGLAEFVTLECDGKDLTPKLKELKVHAIVFLNIPRYERKIVVKQYIFKLFLFSYGGGTHPWNRSMGTSEPSTEDGLIEVVGLTTYQLVSKLGLAPSLFMLYTPFCSHFTSAHLFLTNVRIQTAII